MLCGGGFFEEQLWIFLEQIFGCGIFGGFSLLTEVYLGWIVLLLTVSLLTLFLENGVLWWRVFRGGGFLTVGCISWRSLCKVWQYNFRNSVLFCTADEYLVVPYVGLGNVCIRFHITNCLAKLIQ